MTTGFAGKTALITGAGRGIGRAIALGLARSDARVVLLARTAAQLEETRALLGKRGVPSQRIQVVSADLADEEQRGRTAAAALAAGPGGQDPRKRIRHHQGRAGGPHHKPRG